ncbi:MAG TPA: PKD domain-containing protein [Spirochaetota bacterium]|nr:PKD domain-containing protein [Spirochaetota bacterium]HQG43748.1 PKD domain-containing protein [Spirochaetota bacterium]HRV16013.1 PKD domain-containing protein [Spirochaetota bacterium]
MKRIYIIIGIIAAVMLIFIFLIHSNNDKLKNDDPSKNQSLLNIFQFMSQQEQSEQLPPVDPEKVETYEIEQANFIKDIILEKNPVCAGEDFKVTVIAKNPFGSDAHLVYRISNKLGNPAIMRFNKAGQREFYVTVRDEGKHIDMRKVQITVVECPDKPLVVLSARLHNLEPESAIFEVTSQKGLSGKCTYEWDFGDGTYATTQNGYITHNYASRDQKGLQSSFLVKVTVADANNITATGRNSISFPNVHYLSNLMGNPIIPVLYNKFPSIDSSTITVEVTMKNIFDEAVSFTNAVLECMPCNTEMSPDYKNINPDQLLESTYIAPRSTVKQLLKISRYLLPKSTCNLTITLSGQYPGNREVYAKIYLNIPPQSKEDIDASRDKIITDDDMIEKLNKASKILGKDKPITPQDIQKLEREGKL